MRTKPRACAEIEHDLIAVATGEAGVAEVPRVQAHTAACPPCAREFEGYQAVDRAVSIWGGESAPSDALAHARQRLETGLGDLRRRLLIGRVFDSPLGPLLIARSEEGVSLIEYLDDARGGLRSRLAENAGLELIEDGVEIEALYRDVLEYLEGKRTRLDWPLDLRLARSDFQRAVLRSAVAIPYGAVTSYSGLASEVGKPAGARAVAQALRWNPLPIVVPCHRIVGAHGALVGYAGNKVELKRRLLATEGVQTIAGVPRIDQQHMYVTYPSESSYCLPSCAWIPTAKDPQRFRFFGARERAEAAGLAPCSDCRPDLHPIAH